MAEANGHDAGGAPPPEASDTELDALLSGLFEPTTYEVAPGRTVEIRPLILKNADRLYLGGMAGADLQRFLLARCVYLGGKVLGEAGADRLPVALAGRLVPVVMAANGMDITPTAGEGDEAADPKA